MTSSTLIVTGGAGFIGSALIRHLIAHSDYTVVNVDCLTYAGNLASLASVAEHPRYRFEQVDIRDAPAVERVLACHRPDGILHLAAESHVDRSIDGPADFMQTNILGTYTLLEAARHYWAGLDATGRSRFRFQHISTDEVYGSLGRDGAFSETSCYQPNSPYAASKAASDHLVRAWHHTYGLPVVITNCSNNYGPYQFPEKLIPLMIRNALQGRTLPVYGNGEQVRDWLYVDDHARALALVYRRGRIGEVYNIGGHNELQNIEVVRALCGILEQLRPDKPAGVARYQDLITHVADRPGHDQRYAIDAIKIQQQLGWAPREDFTSGLHKTVAWYLSNDDWCQRVLDGSYSGERLGLQQREGKP